MIFSAFCFSFKQTLSHIFSFSETFLGLDKPRSKKATARKQPMSWLVSFWLVLLFCLQKDMTSHKQWSKKQHVHEFCVSGSHVEIQVLLGKIEVVESVGPIKKRGFRSVQGVKSFLDDIQNAWGVFFHVHFKSHEADGILFFLLVLRILRPRFYLVKLEFRRDSR